MPRSARGAASGSAATSAVFCSSVAAFCTFSIALSPRRPRLTRRARGSAAPPAERCSTICIAWPRQRVDAEAERAATSSQQHDAAPIDRADAHARCSAVTNGASP